MLLSCRYLSMGCRGKLADVLRNFVMLAIEGQSAAACTRVMPHKGNILSVPAYRIDDNGSFTFILRATGGGSNLELQSGISPSLRDDID